MKTDSLSLTITIDNDRLLFFLSDTRRFCKFGWASTGLQNIKSIAKAVSAHELQDLVFPVEISQAIDNSCVRVLSVQIQPELTFLPIDGFESSGQRWCEKYQLIYFLLNPELSATRHIEATNSPSERLKVSFTTTLFNQNHALKIANHLSRKGLFVSQSVSTKNTANVLVADSASDAILHLKSSIEQIPNLCVWTVNVLSDSVGIELSNFIAKYPSCSVITAHGFSSIEEVIVRLTTSICALNAGSTPLHALQSALPIHLNEERVLRLYNSDDMPLCNPPSSSELITENRTITAMSLDVVASTKMMQRIGNERYSEVLAQLKERSIKCIYDRGGSHGGRAGDDSIMAYFGLPNALENTAESAMATALAVRDILPTLPGQPELRIGIATGRVAVRSGVPYGGVIHLAARLQKFGQSGEIFIDATSQWLARHSYEFASCHNYTTFHGIDKPILPIKLIARVTEQSTNLNFSSTAPFTGRDSEISELSQYWQCVCRAQQIVVCVRGEAGIGKSRLVSEFMYKALSDKARVLKIRGLSDYKDGVFDSLKESLRRGFGIQVGDSQARIGERIQESATFSPETVRNIAQVAELLGITDSVVAQSDIEKALVDNAEGNIRDRLFELLTEAIAFAASDHPLVILIDDLQWIDPSAREALEHVIEALRSRSGLKLLILCTERGDQTRQALPFAKTLTLGRLSSQVASQFIRNVVGEALPPVTVNRLVVRAEGVPLFLEESARLALDRPADSLNPVFSVPDSIDSLLMSRLDSLDQEAKYMVQVASVIGRDVQIDLLRSVLQLLSGPASVTNLPTQIESFRRFGVLGNLKAKGPPRLTFRHEMIRDVAYGSMWHRDRITVHAAVARAILEDEDQLFTAQPNMIANHLSLSEQHELAAEQWELAARLAAATSANQESILSLRSALLSLEHLPDNELIAKQEMRLQLMLAARLIASEGYGAEEVRSAYERADVLVRQVGGKRDQIKVLLGLESVHVMRGELNQAESLAATAVDIAGQLPDPKLRTPMMIQARWALGNIRFHQGRPRQALEFMDQCLDDCRTIHHRAFAVQDPEIMCLCYGAWALWERGFADTANKRVIQALELARTRQHRFSEGEALGFYASLSMMRGEHDIAIDLADNAIAICEQEKFAIWLAHARVIKGRSMALTGNPSEALTHMERGCHEWISTGAVITRSLYFSLIAETLLENGELDAALKKIFDAINIINATGDRYHLAEVLRVQGLIAYAQGELHEGDGLVHQAIEIAQSQEKRAYVLRASTAMAEALAERNLFEEAISTLSAALFPIREGFSTGDLRRAIDLLRSWKAMMSTTTAAMDNRVFLALSQSVND